MGRSASRKARNSFAPAPESSATSVDAALGEEARVGSAASYAASSDAKSAGAEGAFGTAGAAKALTTPTCASLAYLKRRERYSKW